MDHLHHLRRDRGGGPWGLPTSPGCPDNPARSAHTPGPVGVADAAEAFIAAGARSVVDPLARVMDAALTLTEARVVFAGKISKALEGLLVTDFALSLPSLNTLEAQPRAGEFPGWFPLSEWGVLHRAAKAWDDALAGADSSGHSVAASTVGLPGVLKLVYGVGERARALEADFTHIEAKRPLPEMVAAFREVAFHTAARQLLGRAQAYEGFRSQHTVDDLIQAMAYFNALSPEWRPAVDERYRDIEAMIEWLEAFAPDLACMKTTAGLLVLPVHAR